MIGDVSKVRLHLPIYRNQFRVLEPVAHFDQRPGRIAQTQQIAAERVQALDVRTAQRGRQHGILDRLDLGLDLLNNWHVIVDDEVEDRIDYVILSLRQNGRTSFAALAHRSIGDGSAMADRYDVAAADKQMRLAEGNSSLHDLRGAGYDEDAVAILLQLGMLMGLAGILDGQRMQIELLLHAFQKFVAGLE